MIEKANNVYQQGKTIRIAATTSSRLDKLRHKGQSYNGLITELLDLYESHIVKNHEYLPYKTSNE